MTAFKRSEKKKDSDGSGFWSLIRSSLVHHPDLHVVGQRQAKLNTDRHDHARTMYQLEKDMDELDD